jgi:hypothetical protein
MHDGCMLSVGACMFALPSASLVFKLSRLLQAAGCTVPYGHFNVIGFKFLRSAPAYRCMTSLRPF